MAQSARALVTKRLRVQNAKQFVESFDELGVLDSGLAYIANTEIRSLLSSTEIISQINGSIADSFYLFVGKLDTWSANDIPESSSIVGENRNTPFDPEGADIPLTVISDTSVPNPADSLYQTDIVNWDDMLLAKRIQRSDISHVIPRITWESGKVYRSWDDRNRNIYNISDDNVGSINANDKDIDAHYIVTEDFNVFKCLNNNRGKITSPGAEPITEGSGFTGPESTVSSTENQDNYVWKYMYTIGSQDAVRFITQTYIPVKTLHKDERDIGSPASGNFEEVTTDTNQRTIERSLAQEVSAGRAQNILTAIPYDNEMYYEGHSFLYIHNSILSGGQFAATSDPLTANLTTSLRGGEFNGDWTNGMLTYIGNNGALTKQYKILGTESATGVITISLDTDDGITTFEDPTSFYDASAGAVIFTGNDTNSYALLGPAVKVNGDGSGAYAYAEAVDNRAGVTFLDAFSEVTSTLDASVSSNWANGINLRLSPLSSLSLAATTISIPETGIDAVRVFDAGQQYYHADMEIVSRDGDMATTPARFRPVINPRWGHGWDAVEELSGFNVMINSRLEGSGIRGSAFGAYTVANDFRKIGIVKNPIAVDTGDYALTPFTANVTSDRAQTELVDQSFRFAVPSVVGGGENFMPDDILRLDTSANITIAYARVVDFPEYTSGTGPLATEITDTDYYYLRVIPEFGYDGFYDFDWAAADQGFITFIVVERSDPNTALTHPNFISRNTIALGLPTLNPYTGEVLYVENRSPVSRSADQTEDLKIILQF